MRGAIPLCCWKSPRCCALVEACYWRRSFWKSAAEAPAAGWLAGWMDGWRPLGSAGKSLDERPRVEVVVLLTSEHTREEPVCQQTSGLWWSQEKLSCTWHCLTREGDSYLHRSRWPNTVRGAQGLVPGFMCRTKTSAEVCAASHKRVGSIEEDEMAAFESWWSCSDWIAQWRTGRRNSPLWCFHSPWELIIVLPLTSVEAQVGHEDWSVQVSLRVCIICTSICVWNNTCCMMNAPRLQLCSGTRCAA